MRILIPFLSVVLGCVFAVETLAAGNSTRKARSGTELVFDEVAYDYELRRNLGYAVSGGADINECFHAARSIAPGDGVSWFKAWNELAERLRADAAHALAGDHRISAREALLRASNYYRSAAFFLHGDPSDPRIVETARLSRETFRRAAALMDRPVEAVGIPYENTSLPGYFLQPDRSSSPRKTLLLQTGFDGTGEELYFTSVFALDRGYNVLIFEGPGQGAALLEQGLHFRRDWEKVVTPVVDYALKRPEVAPGKVALMGLSMGGFLAPRAAAFEHRLAACVANPGQLDLYGAKRPSPKEWEEMLADPAGTDRELRALMAKDVGFRWWINNGMFTTGAKTPLEFMKVWGEFSLEGVVGNIACPTLVIGSDGDHFLTMDDSRALYDRLKCPKTFLAFHGRNQANRHCQVGALVAGTARILDWLDETLK
ncbi:alpha/beta fold hydrolase [Pseudodesulfovibrio cashew]|uniref:Alpha/beta fold hydrolase n=2 Tax=Pseudodesulfovibrio cashew TaxID=2678688 RepID=A0A6I6JPS1_9BACT|nr:alpha/beta fold hydrolase [Pseudodesulfovibrio cashew]